MLGPFGSPIVDAVANVTEKHRKVDQDGVQIAHTMLLFQWQDGQKAIGWPEELAPGQPRLPTPPWSQRP